MKISVVVTSYNYENYIKETLDSLVNQTYKDFDVIIVDDGSKDNSVDVIKQYVNNYPNFYLYTHPNHQNKGIIESLKLGISKSDSDYIVFLESDDYISKDYMQEKVDYLSNHKDCVILINDMERVGNVFNDNYINAIYKYYKTRKSVKNDFGTFYYRNFIPTFSVVMIKTDVLKSLDFNSAIPAWLDWWLWRQVALNYPIHYIDKKLTYWRIHSSSYINRDKKNNPNKFKFIKASDKLLLQKYPQKRVICYKYKLKLLINKIIQFIFSIHNSGDKTHKVIIIFGIKISIKRK